MDSNIVAALITAFSSIVVAVIGTVNISRDTAQRSEKSLIPRRNKRIWQIAALSMVGWLVFATLYVHWDIGGMSGLLIPILVVILSVVFPIKPNFAAAYTLILFPFAFAAEPLGKLSAGVSIDNHFEAGVIWIYLSFAFGTAILVWLITRYRIRTLDWSNKENQQSMQNNVLTKQLAEITKLHREGALSDEEFTQAKSKLLSE